MNSSASNKKLIIVSIVSIILIALTIVGFLVFKGKSKPPKTSGVKPASAFNLANRYLLSSQSQSQGQEGGGAKSSGTSSPSKLMIDNQEALLSGDFDSLPEGFKTIKDNNGKVVEIIDPFGNSTKITYDANGQVEAITDCFGNQMKCERYEDGKVKDVTDIYGHMFQYSYNQDGTVKSVKNFLNHELAFEYNDKQQVVSMDVSGDWDEKILPGGLKRSFTYNDAGELIQESDGSGNSVYYSSLDDGTKVQLSVPAGYSEPIDPESAWASMTKGLGYSAFDEKGQKTWERTPDGNEVNYEYNDKKQPTKIDYGNNQSVMIDYDNFGNRTKETVSMTNQETSKLETKQVDYEYEPNGLQLKRAVQSDGTFQEYEYYSNNDIRLVRDHTGSQTIYNYYDDNPALTHRIKNIVQTNPQTGEEITIAQFKYNEIGELSEKIDQQGNAEAYKYENLPGSQGYDPSKPIVFVPPVTPAATPAPTVPPASSNSPEAGEQPATPEDGGH
ncbi:MAG: hypothetical protein V1753_05415 [Pseudomonadota bacterium]